MSFEMYKTYDVTPYVPEILGGKLTAIKVISIMAYEQARQISTVNLYDLHQSLIGKIDMLPTNVNDLTYIMFKDSNDKTLILAQEYIDLFVVSETELVDINVRIFNTSKLMKQVIELRLQELGFTDFTVDLVHS